MVQRLRFLFFRPPTASVTGASTVAVRVHLPCVRMAGRRRDRPRCTPPGRAEFQQPRGGINERGEVTGVSENGIIDPITGLTEIRAVVWKDGQILDLGTLGGNPVKECGINDPRSSHGDSAKRSLIRLPEPGETDGKRAFLWDERSGMQDLGTLGGPDAVAEFHKSARANRRSLPPRDYPAA